MAKGRTYQFVQNATEEQTGCSKAGKEGVVCCCALTNGQLASQGPHEDSTKFFVCGVGEGTRNTSGGKWVTTFYKGIAADGSKHHIAELVSSMMGSFTYRVNQRYFRRRFQKH